MHTTVPSGFAWAGMTLIVEMKYLILIRLISYEGKLRYLSKKPLNGLLKRFSAIEDSTENCDIYVHMYKQRIYICIY